MSMNNNDFILGACCGVTANNLKNEELQLKGRIAAIEIEIARNKDRNLPTDNLEVEYNKAIEEYNHYKEVQENKRHDDNVFAGVLIGLVLFISIIIVCATCH